MKKDNYKKKRYRFRSNRGQNNKINYITIFILIFTIIGSFVFLKLGLDSQKGIRPDYSYSVQKSSPYEVLLLPNDFYEEDVLPSNCYYASKSIDFFIINFKYNFKGSRQTNLEYTYSITADLIGTVDVGDGLKREVWTRNYILQENITNPINNAKEFLVDKNIKIDYKNYNNLARAYEKQYGITIETNLKIHFNIDYLIDLTSLNLSKEKIEDNIELNIPITNNITNVNEDYQKEITKDFFSNNEKLNVKKSIFYVLSGVFLLGAIFVVIIRIILKNKSTPEEVYNHNIKRILKYCKDLIVTVSNEPNLSNLEVMSITVLDDLIDVAEQNQSNIIHYEVEKNEKSNLYVIVGNYVYIYVVTASDIIR